MHQHMSTYPSVPEWILRHPQVFPDISRHITMLTQGKERILNMIGCVKNLLDLIMSGIDFKMVLNRSGVVLNGLERTETISNEPGYLRNHSKSQNIKVYHENTGIIPHTGKCPVFLTIPFDPGPGQKGTTCDPGHSLPPGRLRARAPLRACARPVSRPRQGGTRPVRAAACPGQRTRPS